MKNNIYSDIFFLLRIIRFFYSTLDVFLFFVLYIFNGNCIFIYSKFPFTLSKKEIKTFEFLLLVLVNRSSILSGWWQRLLEYSFTVIFYRIPMALPLHCQRIKNEIPCLTFHHKKKFRIMLLSLWFAFVIYSWQLEIVFYSEVKYPYPNCVRLTWPHNTIP